jgi:hypothetical protein
MTTAAIEQALQAALAPRDLLTHPFYQAWSPVSSGRTTWRGTPSSIGSR